MSKTLKKLYSLILLLTMAISMLPTAANAEESLTVFATFDELQALAAQEYNEYTSFNYIGTHTLTIEQDLCLPQNTSIFAPESKIVIPANTTLTSSELTCAELVVNGTLDFDNSITIYDLLSIAGNILCSGIINIYDSTELIGYENIAFDDEGFSSVNIIHYISNETELQEVCARAASDTRTNVEYSFIIREPLTISNHITIPANSDLNPRDLIIAENGTLEIYGGCIVSDSFTVYGTLINNADFDADNYFGIYPDENGKLEIAPNGTYMGNGDFFVWGFGNFDPNTAFSGIDLSHYSVTCDTEYGTSWYYTYIENSDPPAVKLPTLVGTYTTDLVMSAADLGVSAPDSVLRATLTFREDGTASCTWEAVDLTAFRIFFHDMFVNAYYAMAYGAGITDINEIEQFCIDSTGMSVSAYMDTLVTEQAMIESFTPASTSGTYRYNADHSAIFTDLAIMDIPSDPNVENSFVLGGGTLYLNAASWGKPDYTFVCTSR